MIKEVFIKGDSVLHHLDPRVKLIFSVFYSFTVALMVSLPPVVLALLMALGWVWLGQLRFRSLIKRLLLVNGFIAIIWLVLPFTTNKGPGFPLGPFEIYPAGLELALIITLKSNSILMVFICLVNTTSVHVMGKAMAKLKVPDKITYIFLITYRYIFLIYQEYQKLVRAARIRCFYPGTNLHTYRTYAWFVGALFVRAWTRADRVYLAMLCRGFTGRFHCLEEFTFTRKDGVISTVMGIGLVLLIGLEWIHRLP